MYCAHYQHYNPFIQCRKQSHFIAFRVGKKSGSHELFSGDAKVLFFRKNQKK